MTAFSAPEQANVVFDDRVLRAAVICPADRSAAASGQPQPWHHQWATADRYLIFLDHLSRITWQIRVARQLSGHNECPDSELPSNLLSTVGSRAGDTPKVLR